MLSRIHMVLFRFVDRFTRKGTTTLYSLTMVYLPVLLQRDNQRSVLYSAGTAAGQQDISLLNPLGYAFKCEADS